jgi:hypothetical protein
MDRSPRDEKYGKSHPQTALDAAMRRRLVSIATYGASSTSAGTSRSVASLTPRAPPIERPTTATQSCFDRMISNSRNASAYHCAEVADESAAISRP